MDEHGRTTEWLTDAFDVRPDWSGATGPARLFVGDPDAPRYRPLAGEGVEVEEVAPGIHLIGFEED